MLLVFLCLVVLPPGAMAQSVTPTPIWTDFWGTRAYLDGHRAEPGTLIEAFDADGVLCGLDSVRSSGEFGPIHVYGDDPSSEPDEGAESGDVILFRLGGDTATVVGSTVWSSGTPGETSAELGLYVGGFPPIFTDMPSLVSFQEDGDITVNAGDHLEDLNTPLYLQQWALIGGEDLNLRIKQVYSITGDLVIDAGLNKNGEVEAYLRVTDHEGFADSVLIDFLVEPQPDPVYISSPDFVQAVEDKPFEYTATAIDADGTEPLWQILNLSQWLNVEGIVVSGLPTEGILDGAFTLIASDELYSDTVEVTITVEPVNDPPSAFLLVEPDDGAMIVLRDENGDSVIHFFWEEATDPELSSLSYDLALQGPSGSVSVGTSLTTNSLSLSINDLRSLFENVGLPEGGQAEWQVQAKDGLDSTLSFNGPYALNLDIALYAPGSENGLPKSFALMPIWPNPFNSDATVRFAMPEQILISIDVYDVLGRKVTTLVDGIWPAGIHTVNWKADMLGSGIYFLCMKVNQNMFVQRAILIQ